MTMYKGRGLLYIFCNALLLLLIVSLEDNASKVKQVRNSGAVRIINPKLVIPVHLAIEILK